MNNLQRILEKIDKLAAACRAEIESSDRPLDAVPTRWVIPLFLVNPDHVVGWEQSVAAEVWDRIQHLQQERELLVGSEEELKRTPFALSDSEQRQFRNGPVLRMMLLMDLWRARNQGGRTKSAVEIAVRKALAFEVFRRDIEISALISCLSERFDNKSIPIVKGGGLNVLAEQAWVPGVPTKGKVARAKIGIDKKLAQFEALRPEGEKLAVARIPGLEKPSDLEPIIVAQAREAAGTAQSKADFENAIRGAGSWVRILMQACAHLTEISEEKHKLAKRAKKIEALRRPPKDGNLFWREPMTRQQHALFSGDEFSAVELAVIAVVADVDPNLITANHILATPEFRLARKLGRIGRGVQATFDLDDEWVLREFVLGQRGHADGAMFQGVHRFLAGCARDIGFTAE